MVEQLRRKNQAGKPDVQAGKPDDQAGTPDVGGSSSSNTTSFLQMIGQEVPSSGVTVEYFGEQPAYEPACQSGSETEASEETPMQLERERSHQEQEEEEQLQLEQERGHQQVQPQRRQNEGQQKQQEKGAEIVPGRMMPPTAKAIPAAAMKPPDAKAMPAPAAEIASTASASTAAVQLSLEDQLNMYHAAERHAAHAYNVNWKERGPPAPLHPGYKFLNQSFREREGNASGPRWGNRGGRNKLYWEVARKHGYEAAAHLWIPPEGEKGGGGKGKEGGRKGGKGNDDSGKTGVGKGGGSKSSCKGGGGTDDGSKGYMGMGGGKGSAAHGAGVGGEHRQGS